MKKILIMDGFSPAVKNNLITKLQEKYGVEIEELPDMDNSPDLVKYAQSFVEKIKNNNYDLVLVPKGYTAMNDDMSGFELSDKIKLATKSKILVYGYGSPEPLAKNSNRFLKLAMENHSTNYCQIDSNPEITIMNVERIINSILRD